MSAAGANNIRPRSQTFPMLGVEQTFTSTEESTEALTPMHLQQIMASPALETPVEELSEPPLAAKNALRQQSRSGSLANTPNPNSSPTLMAPPPHPSTSTSSPNNSNISSPISPPSQDEARRALELVMNFFSTQPSGVVDRQEYIIMGKLMEKLKVQGAMGELPGGMHSMVVGEKEMSRKRSIHSL